MAVPVNPPRQVGAVIFVVSALVIVVFVSVLALIWGSEDATSVEASSQAQAEAAMAAIEIPDGTDVGSADESVQDVSFEDVVAGLAKQGEDTSTGYESALAPDPASVVCSDTSLTHLCTLVRDELGSLPTVLMTPTEQPIPKPTVAPARATDTTAKASGRGAAPAPTRVPPRPVPITATPVPEPSATTPEPSAPTATPAPVAETTTPEPVIEPPESTPVSEPTAEPTQTDPVAPVTGVDTVGDIVYIYTEPPSAENPSPPVMECRVEADGSLDCPGGN